MPVLYIIFAHTVPTQKCLNVVVLSEVRAYFPFRKKMYMQTVQVSSNQPPPPVCEACAFMWFILANFKNQSIVLSVINKNVDGL